MKALLMLHHFLAPLKSSKPQKDLSTNASLPSSAQSFEALNQRAVAVVVDPIQSVKGKVVIDAFRLINPQTMMLGQEPRQTTSNLGHLNKPSIQVWRFYLQPIYGSRILPYQRPRLFNPS